MYDFLSAYIEDTREYLELLSESLMLLEREPDSQGAINEAFRAFHSMKSSTAAMEFKQAAYFIHRMEDLLSEIRDGKIKVTPRIIKLLLDTHDLLADFLNQVILHSSEGEMNVQAILSELEKVVHPDVTEFAKAETVHTESVENSQELMERLSEPCLTELKGRVYRVRLKLDDACIYKTIRIWLAFVEMDKISNIIWSSPVRPSVEEFKSGRFQFDGNIVVAEIVSELGAEDIQSHLMGSLCEIDYVEVEPVESRSRGNFQTEDDKLSSLIDTIIGDSVEPAKKNEPVSPPAKKLGEILVENGCLTAADVDEILKIQKNSEPNMKFGQIAIRENKADVKDVAEALEKQADKKTGYVNQTYIRIPAQKVDNLVDLLGELLITQSLHKQEISGFCNQDNKFLNNILRMERIAKDIQDISLSLRMVSLKQTFQKLYRIGRDTASELCKNVSIDMSGEETEIDRNIVDKIQDPLMHIVRNSISHGIEGAAERAAAGKSPQGHIRIQAFNRRGNVCIQIGDDGRGLSAEKIYKKALEKKLIDPQENYTEDEILRFVYLPGFSTADTVNNISGRGVGMNVVQTEISRLGGKVDIDNHPGRGCTFILKIPVNLATINGTIVNIHGSNYVIPTLSIKQIFKPEYEQWVTIKGVRSMVRLRDEILQVMPMEKILEADGKAADREACLVIVVEYDQKLMAMPVTSIQGKQEIVVKSIGSEFSHLNFLSGATILGDGKVSLILDIEALYKMTEEIGPGTGKGS